MKVLVTGVKGQLGNDVVNELTPNVGDHNSQTPDYKAYHDKNEKAKGGKKYERKCK